MLVRGRKAGFAAALLVVPLLLFFALRLYDEKLVSNLRIPNGLKPAGHWTGTTFHPDGDGNTHDLNNLPPVDLQSQNPDSSSSSSSSSASPPSSDSSPPSGETSAQGLSTNPNYRKNGAQEGTPPLPPHREIYSQSTPDKKYFRVKFGDEEAINPNIIPHPQFNDTWIVVGQKQPSDVDKSIFYTELVCNAKFNEDKTILGCISSPLILPIAATSGGKCKDDMTFVNFNIGPHDGRVFFGPDHPYTIFGSNSAHTCFGMWIQDLRMLTDWGLELSGLDMPYRSATELQRPPPWGEMEKNWFVFWDTERNMYAHYDSWPKRSFARIDANGAVVEDYTDRAAMLDQKCIDKYMLPAPPPSRDAPESIHQATNSLAITMCKRGECEPSPQNTFVMQIFQFKSYWSFHGVYEPFVMLFKQTAPFEIHAISTNPLWISGRGAPGSPGDDPLQNESQTEMMYVTSISWKDKRNKYQGFLDDVMFLAFGIEDHRPAAIDVLAGDLVKDLGLCSQA